MDVLGVGGVQSVPGFFLDNVTVGSQGEDISLNHVAVLVLNVADPRNPSTPLPGILGMNLFGDRDLIINADVNGSDTTFLAFGPAITPKWTFNGNGTWGDDTKWSLGTPDGPDLKANFTDAITGAATVTVDSSGFTVGQISFDNANRYTIAGPGTITLEAFTTGTSAISVVSGSHTISAPVTLHSNTTITVTPANGTLTMSGDLNGGSVMLTKDGVGALEMKHVRAGTFNVSAGTVMIAANGTNTGASRVTALTIAGGATPTAKLNLTNNAMAIDYTGTSPASSVRDLLQAGFANGAWTGNGITSSHAAAIAADSSNTHKTAIGFAEASAIGNPTTWFGQSVDGTSLLMRYTFSGDANLDGHVNSGDFTSLSQNFNGSGRFWWHGDFNFDGIVNALDFNMIATNFGQVMTSEALGALVPEPSFACLALSTCLLLRRRPRAQ